MAQQDPVEYVAPEIWAIIFDKLQLDQGNDAAFAVSSNDLLNSSRVCVTFHNILEGTKGVWLFPEVFPLLFPYLEGPDILTCRQVALAWKHVVDKFLENEQSHLRRYLISHQNHDSRLKITSLPASLISSDHPWNLNVFQSTYSFTKTATIIHFLEHLKDFKGNPFPGKSVAFDYQLNLNDTPENRYVEYDRHNQFWGEAVSQLLCRFGMHLTVLEIFISFHARFSPANFYTLLKEYLKLTPNLRRLRIKSVSDDTLNDTTAAATAVDIINFCTDPMPPLEALESLEFCPGTKFLEYSPLPLVLQQKIATPYLQTLKRLHVSFTDGPALIPFWWPESLPNLEELKIELVCAAQFKSFLPGDFTFQKLSSVIIVITTYYDKSLKSSPNEWHPELGDFLQPLKSCTNCLEELVIDADRSAWGCASQKDLDTLKEFGGLKYLHINNFWFPQLRVLDNIPKTVKFLRLSGYFSCGYQRIFKKLHIPGDILCLEEDLFRKLEEKSFLK